MNWDAIGAVGEAVRVLTKLVEPGFDALTADETLRSEMFLNTFFHGIDSIYKLHEKGLVDPENCENSVENQLDWWPNPHVRAYIRSRPGPISKRFATYIEGRIAERPRID